MGNPELGLEKFLTEAFLPSLPRWCSPPLSAMGRASEMVPYSVFDAYSLWSQDCGGLARLPRLPRKEHRAQVLCSGGACFCCEGSPSILSAFSKASVLGTRPSLGLEVVPLGGGPGAAECQP